MEPPVPAISSVEIPPEILGPTARSERITALDTLRGFALLGVLLMNIVGMGMYNAAYDDPTVYGGDTGLNLAVWAVLHVLAEGKMRCLFSLVFGASVVLLTSRLERHGRPSAAIYYRRSFWLLLFGLTHEYLLWLGDILFPYSLCGLLLYPFRKMPAARLLAIGGSFLLLTAGLYIANGFHQRDVLQKGRQAEKLMKSGEKLSTDEIEAKTNYEHWLKIARPSVADLEQDKQAWRGSPLSVIKVRARWINKSEVDPLYETGSWDIWSMMFLGMGLLKLGVLSATRPAREYWRMVIIGYGIGLPLNCVSAWLIIRSHFDPVTQSFAHATYDVERFTIALGHLGVIMLLCQSRTLPWLTARLGEVGHMAFSNYILQSVLTAFFFTGYGLRFYGQLQRYQLYYVVAGVWVINVVFSHYWLQHYRFGPLEWCWRSLTYWQRQPMRLAVERVA